MVSVLVNSGPEGENIFPAQNIYISYKEILCVDLITQSQ